MWANNKTPCYQCSDRAIGCHNTCETYKSYKASCDSVNNKMYADRAVDNAITEISINGNKSKARRRYNCGYTAR